MSAPRPFLPHAVRDNDAIDPNVWTGGALQERSVSVGVFGLAPMYPALRWSSWAPGHHGYERAFDLISGQASSGLFGSPVLACAGKTGCSIALLLSRRPRWECDRSDVLPWVFAVRCRARAGPSRRPSAGLHPYFCSTPPEAYFRPDRGMPRPARADAVKAGPSRATRR